MQITDFPDMPAMMQQAIMRAVTAQHDGQLFDADRLYAQMIRRKPLHPLIANTAGGFHLLKGDFIGAWELFEQRLGLPYYTHRPFANLPQPMWTGDEAPDARLLIFSDMGLGDTVLLARFLPWVQGRVKAIALHVNPGTAGFWRRRLPDAEINERDDPLPACDLKINMFCLPRLFGADAANMPAPGYLQASGDERRFWRGRLGGGPGLKVGVTWQGNPDHVRDFERSIPFDALSSLLTDPLLADAGVRFYSVQLYHGSADAAGLAAAGGIVDLSSDMMARDPLEASAALIDEFDLTIAVDSALANLAAAMDRPVWVPTYKVPDWRWRVFPDLSLDQPEPGSWYRSHRVYACSERGVWGDVVQSMTRDLRSMTGGA